MNATAILEGESEVSIRDLLTERRSQLGLSQKDVADRAEVTLSAYKQYETDRVKPPLDKAIRIANVLNFDPRDFFEALGVPRSTAVAPQETAQTTLNPQIKRTLTELATLVGGRVVFGNEAESQEVFPDNITHHPAYTALKKVHNFAEWKGIHSKHLPGIVTDAKVKLKGLDLDDLETVAEDFGVQIKRTDEDALRDMRPDQREKACDRLIPRLLVAAIYGSDIEFMDFREMEAIHDALSERSYAGKPLIVARGWYREQKDQVYEERLRRELCGWLLDALALGVPLPTLDIRSEGEGEDAEEVEGEFPEEDQDVEDVEDNKDDDGTLFST